jgi:signal peptidase I
MEPTYLDKEILIAERLSDDYRPKRYDIVVIGDLFGEDNITKRILGLPNEKLELIQGKIFINNKFLDDPYFKGEWFHEKKIYHIPSDCIWVIGDNRSESHYGIYLIKEVKGLVK